MPRFPNRIAERPRFSQFLAQCGLAAALMFCVCGCRSDAYSDVYRQKMAGEIRVLEDQLYEADYENQVLRDEVSRAQMKAAQIIVPESRPPRSLFGKTRSEGGEIVDVPKERPKPKLPARPLDGNTPSLKPPPADEKSLLPPAEPVPPGASDLEIPDVELGDPMPPPAGNAPESLPGKIELPDLKILGMESLEPPVAIRINSGLSGGHKTDDVPAIEGVLLIVEAIDESGAQVPLEEFDIAASLSVVLLDPARSGDQARLGKWDFGPEQIRDMIHPGGNSLLGSGLHIVIPWGETRPEATTVIAHVKLAADEVVMQTQAEIATAQPAMAQWTPRAKLIR